MYQVGARSKSKKRRWFIWLIVLIGLILLAIWGVAFIREKLKPKTVIKQSTATQTKVTYASATKHYDEPDFGIDLPNDWTPVTPAAPTTPYQTYTWQTDADSINGQMIEIFENVIPVNYAVNRALIVEGEIDHLTINGAASDNCSAYTKNPAIASTTGAPAKWQGVDFLCDQGNTERDVLGTSSSDGVNTVILRTSTGVSHKFFFSYTDHSQNPDYTIFYNALNSLKMN